LFFSSEEALDLEFTEKTLHYPPPSVWIIPAKEVAQFIRKYETRTVISRANVRAKGQCFFHAWSLIIGQKAS